MLQNIPTHVIAGPLGAGKTSVIHQLLAQRPPGERWAVLINEFGQIGLDAALLSRDDDGVTISEVAGGCLCCVNGMPFQVGLGRLLRKARPDRVFIEPSGLGHPVELIEQLRRAPWVGVLDVQPLVMVLDAQRLAAGDGLPDAQLRAMDKAKLLVINKIEAVDELQRQCITSRLPVVSCLWTTQGYIPVDCLPVQSHPHERQPDVDNLVRTSELVSSGDLWISTKEPICIYQQGEGGWSIGWRWHPSRHFAIEAVDNFLARWPWRRAKLVIHSPDGWHSYNGLDEQPAQWRASEWRRDSRIELIFDQPQPAEALKQALQACILYG